MSTYTGLKILAFLFSSREEALNLFFEVCATFPWLTFWPQARNKFRQHLLAKPAKSCYQLSTGQLLFAGLRLLFITTINLKWHFRFSLSIGSTRTHFIRIAPVLCQLSALIKKVAPTNAIWEEHKDGYGIPWLEQNDVICIWYLLWIYNARETLKETLQQVMQ